MPTQSAPSGIASLRMISVYFFVSITGLEDLVFTLGLPGHLEGFVGLQEIAVVCPEAA